MSYDVLINDFSLFSPCFADLYTKKPVIHIIHHILGLHAVRKYPVIGIFPYLAERLNLKISKNIITVSKGLLEVIKSRYGNKKIVCIYNGVDNKYFESEASEENFILFLGRIDIYMKGLDILVKSFARVISKLKNQYKLIIAGRGKEKDIQAIEKQFYELHLHEFIELKGEVSEEEKISLLSRCMFLCMPSRFEGWGISAIEAAAAGKPVLGTKIEGLKEAVIDKKTGILIEPADDEKFAEGIIQLIKEKRLRKELGSNSRKHAQNFKWDKIALEHEEFLKELMEKT